MIQFLKVTLGNIVGKLSVTLAAPNFQQLKFSGDATNSRYICRCLPILRRLFCKPGHVWSPSNLLSVSVALINHKKKLKAIFTELQFCYYSVGLVLELNKIKKKLEYLVYSTNLVRLSFQRGCQI